MQPHLDCNCNSNHDEHTGYVLMGVGYIWVTVVRHDGNGDGNANAHTVGSSSCIVMVSIYQQICTTPSHIELFITYKWRV